MLHMKKSNDKSVKNYEKYKQFDRKEQIFLRNV